MTRPAATNRWLFAALSTLVALAPFPLASNRPLPMALLGLSSGLLLTLWALIYLRNHRLLHQHFKDLKWVLFSYSVVCLWILVQAATWSPTWLTDPAWQSAGKIFKVHLGGHLSVNPSATFSGLMHLLVYASVFWLTFQLTHTAERAWAAVRTVTWIGSAYALYGIIIYMSGNNWIVIYPKWAYQDSLTSTFVNRNSYATFAGLTLLCAFTAWLNHFEPFFTLRHPARLKTALIVEEAVAKAGFKTFTVLITAIALLLSASRGGVASSFIGLLVLALLYLSQKRLGLKQLGIFLAASTLTALIIFSASGNLLSKRLPNEQIDSSYRVRNGIYQTTWNAIMISPWKGTGFGTFEDVFPAYRTADTSPLILWDKAHNTYLENALELGLPAAILLNLSIALIAFQCLHGTIIRKRNRLLPALGVGATVLVGLHSLVDFSLQIPAVTILYACIMGIATSQSWSQGNSTRP